jgi:glyoxylase-like metal-dependent hydrolase (beta-lactamase superfamily II)
VTSQPVIYLVYSHEHTDHIGAAYLFPKDVKILAQKQAAEILAQRKDPRRPLPTITFTNIYELSLGGQALVFDYPGINHERGNIFIYARERGGPSIRAVGAGRRWGLGRVVSPLCVRGGGLSQL